ncbi:MAG: helix-turn-helix transcriptional regulator [Sneathiella sp.]|nr:helix-turn-helix transcriptional regulator [Sneathiella sp.]
MPDNLTRKIAERLKNLRNDRGWSLDRLSTLSGVSRATLSRIENADVSATTEVLGKLCSAYSLTLSRLLLMAEENFNPIVRQNSQEVWTDPDAGFIRRTLSPPTRQLKAEVLECELKASARITYDNPSIHGLEHHLMLLSGYLEVTVDGTTHHLRKGDCLRYQLFGATEFRTANDKAAKYILVLVGA